MLYRAYLLRTPGVITWTLEAFLPFFWHRANQNSKNINWSFVRGFRDGSCLPFTSRAKMKNYYRHDPSKNSNSWSSFHFISLCLTLPLTSTRLENSILCVGCMLHWFKARRNDGNSAARIGILSINPCLLTERIGLCSERRIYGILIPISINR